MSEKQIMFKYVKKTHHVFENIILRHFLIKDLDSKKNFNKIKKQRFGL